MGERFVPVRERVKKVFCEGCEKLAECRPLSLWIPGDRRRRYLKQCRCGVAIIHLEEERGTRVAQG
jgi:hypothetical protein